MGNIISDLWDDFTGESNAERAQDATNAANAANLAATQQLAESLKVSSAEELKARQAATQKYSDEMIAALAKIPGAEQVVAQMKQANAQYATEANQALTQGRAGAEAAYNRVPGMVDQAMGQARTDLGGINSIVQSGRTALAPWTNAALGQLGAVDPLLVALGLKEGDAGAALRTSPLYQRQSEQMNKGMAGALASRGMGSGRTAVRQLTEANRDLFAQEMDKNIGRLRDTAQAGMQGANLATYGNEALIQNQRDLANLSGTGLQYNVAALNQIGQLYSQFAPLFEAVARQNQMNQTNTAQQGEQLAGNQFNRNNQVQTALMNNIISNSQFKANTDMALAKMIADAQMGNAANTARTAQQIAAQPTLMQQIIPAATSWALGGMGSVRAPSGLGGGGQIPSTIGATNPMPAWSPDIVRPW
jgi:hypothetical protein